VLELRGLRRGGSRDAIRWLRMRLYGACVSPGMRANLSTRRVLTSDGTKSDSGRCCTFGRTAGRAMRPEWIYFQGFYFESKGGGEVRIFGFSSIQKNKDLRRALEINISCRLFLS